LCELPADQYRVFSGVAPLGLTFEAHTALVHADGSTPELAELITEMAERTDSGYLFGGLASSRSKTVQFAVGGDGFIRGQGLASGVFRGGLSGVAFGEGVQLVSRVTQGCLPVSKPRVVTKAERNVVLELDGEPALDVLLSDLNVSLDQPKPALDAMRATLVGLLRPGAAGGCASDGSAVGRTGNFGPDVLVRHIIGLDANRHGIAVADQLEEGMQMTFCQRNAQAARADLIRVCAEIREELEPEEMTVATAQALGMAEAQAEPHPARRIAGAIYVSCSGRGGPHFGGPSAELQIVRRALGDVPLVGFFAGGEIARNHLYGYTGVLTVFTGE
jgi:small ligand-binding sensory domain FIST